MNVESRVRTGIAAAELQARRERLLEHVRANGLAGYVLFDDKYIQYFTSFGFLATERPVAFASTASGEMAVFAPELRTLADHRRGHGFAPQVRIGLHAAAAARTERSFRGKGVHEAARIAALAEGEQIVASLETAASAPGRFAMSEPRTVSLKGLTEPVQLVTIEWR